MITAFANARYLRIVGFAVGAVAVAVGALWVTASAAGYNVALFSPSSKATQATTTSVTQHAIKPSAVCSDFISHLSSDLGTDQSKVNAAIQKAISQTIDDEIKNKDITQAQGDALKKKLTGTTPCALIPAGTLKPARTAGTGSSIGAYTRKLLSAAASALGVTDQVLMTDLAQGMTLSQVAGAQNPVVTEDQFRTRLIQNLTPLLDKAVAARQLTTAQEQAIIKKLQTGTIPFWSKPMHAIKSPIPAAHAAGSTSSTT